MIAIDKIALSTIEHGLAIVFVDTSTAEMNLRAPTDA